MNTDETEKEFVLFPSYLCLSVFICGSFFERDAFEDDDFAEGCGRMEVALEVIAQRRVTLRRHVAVARQNQVDVIGVERFKGAGALHCTDADAAPELRSRRVAAVGQK